jgi:diguanylate cyclase (GGDEF)-like protein
MTPYPAGIPKSKTTFSVANIAHKLSDTISAAYETNGTQLAVRLSIGIALYPNDGEAAEVLLKNADAAMYKAKQRKAGVLFCSETGPE